MEESVSSPKIFASKSSASPRNVSVEPYDFKQPKLVSKGIMKGLQNIHDLVSRSLTRIFTDSINQKVEVSLEDIDERIFSEFLNVLEAPEALFLFNIKELSNWTLIEIPPSFCLYCIERQGGSRTAKVKPPKALSRIEERIISRIIKKVSAELSHAWSPYMNITFEDYVYESKPANVRTISSHVPGIIVTFKVKTGDITMPIRICYPYAMLKDQMDNSLQNPNTPYRQRALDSKEQHQFETYMKQVDVPLQVILGQANITMKELLNLTEGDVIKLGQPIDKPLPVLINGTQKMNGYPGNYNGNRAVKIFDILTPVNTD
ncbi:flagellar motor switch protein FliM [Fodinibius sediminis]|uniref:Flagellar motor switch protein FliM n=1 Tax=Fodinibius sediminis TaxID=1214077 RepID=A0A521CIJ0_9BACT|nr:FliM/FliN family flagellar motor switch protein [Fodinibius sediminis]SMO59248.1 flagellar motor switch protein FliM [Fodinibius sediminis]